LYPFGLIDLIEKLHVHKGIVFLKKLYLIPSAQTKKGLEIQVWICSTITEVWYWQREGNLWSPNCLLYCWGKTLEKHIQMDKKSGVDFITQHKSFSNGNLCRYLWFSNKRRQIKIIKHINKLFVETKSSFGRGKQPFCNEYYHF